MRHIKAPVAGALLVLLLLPGIASGASRYTDLRVVTHTGETLADVRQYTDDVRFRASRKADCFGEENPSSNRRHRLSNPNMLGALLEAGKHIRKLRPILVTDAFFDDFGSFGVCDIGGFATEGFSFWYQSANHVGATAGANQIPVRNGDLNLHYLTRGDESASPSELVLRAPARVRAGQPFRVRVTRFAPDGEGAPAAGVQVTSAAAPTNAQGRTQVSLAAGNRMLKATGGPEDIPSARVKVCSARKLSACPRKRGKRILGSSGPDKIRSTAGPDRIKCGRGRDVVIVKRGDRDDRIARDCERKRRK